MRFSLRRAPRGIACIEFVELVTAYLEESLSDGERRAFEHHLTGCDGCSAYLQQMRETRRLTGMLRLDDVPVEGIDELMAAYCAYRRGEDV